MGAAASAQDVKSDQQVLIELEQLWDAAFHRGDAKYIETLLADEFIATYGDGSRGDKAKELSLAGDNRQQVDSSRLDEFIVKTFGNTAVVWFTQFLVGPVNGKPTEVRVVDGTGVAKVDERVAKQLLAGRYRPLVRDGRRVEFCERATVIVTGT